MANGNISAILGGTGGLTKTTAGTVTLTRANTYTGVTTVNAGILSVSSLANGGAASNIGASTSAAETWSSAAASCSTRVPAHPSTATTR